MQKFKNVMALGYFLGIHPAPSPDVNSIDLLPSDTSRDYTPYDGVSNLITGDSITRTHGWKDTDTGYALGSINVFVGDDPSVVTSLNFNALTYAYEQDVNVVVGDSKTIFVAFTRGDDFTFGGAIAITDEFRYMSHPSYSTKTDFISGDLSADIVPNSYKLYKVIFNPESCYTTSVIPYVFNRFNGFFEGSRRFLFHGKDIDTHELGSTIHYLGGILNFRTVPSPHSYVWQLPREDGAVATITTTTTPSSKLSLGAVSTSVDPATHVPLQVLFKNINMTLASGAHGVIVSRVILTVETPYLSSLAPSIREAILLDFAIPSVSFILNSTTTVIGSTIDYEFYFDTLDSTTTPFKFLKALVFNISFIPTVKVAPTPAMFVPYNAASAPSLSALINANRKAKIQVYGFLPSDTVNEVAIGDPLYINGSAV